MYKKSQNVSQSNLSKMNSNKNETTSFVESTSESLPSAELKEIREVEKNGNGGKLEVSYEVTRYSFILVDYV